MSHLSEKTVHATVGRLCKPIDGEDGQPNQVDGQDDDPA